MNVAKWLYALLFGIPLWWLLTMLLMLTIGYIRLGVVPVYGIPEDPFSLGLEPLSLINVILFLLTLVIAPVLTGFLLGLYGSTRSFRTHHPLAVYFFVAGIIGLLLLILGFDRAFHWVLD